MRNRHMSLVDQLKNHPGEKGEVISWMDRGQPSGRAEERISTIMEAEKLPYEKDRPSGSWRYLVYHEGDESRSSRDEEVIVSYTNTIWDRVSVTMGKHFTDTRPETTYYLHIKRSTQCPRCGCYDEVAIAHIREIDQWDELPEVEQARKTHPTWGAWANQEPLYDKEGRFAAVYGSTLDEVIGVMVDKWMRSGSNMGRFCFIQATDHSEHGL